MNKIEILRIVSLTFYLFSVEKPECSVELPKSSVDIPETFGILPKCSVDLPETSGITPKSSVDPPECFGLLNKTSVELTNSSVELHGTRVMLPTHFLTIPKGVGETKKPLGFYTEQSLTSPKLPLFSTELPLSYPKGFGSSQNPFG